MVEAVILGLFDVLMCAGLIGLAWQLLNTEDLFSAVVLFIAFGLLMALTWVRLMAPDVALAEAAIGAGVTGVLLLSALRRLQTPFQAETRWNRKTALAMTALAVLVVLGLIWAVIQGGDVPNTAKQAAMNHLNSSGVTNPVTAVLLNFRGYDTLLEIVVLFAAVLGVWSLGQAQPTLQSEPNVLLSAAVRLLIPVMIVVAVYLLWIGARAPGGAFQGGAVLAAAGLLWWLVRQDKTVLQCGRWLGIAVLLGPLVFVLSALIMMFWGGNLLEYPKGLAGGWILLIESAVMISIAAILLALFLGGRPQAKQNHRDEGEGA